MTSLSVPAPAIPVRLGLRENLGQFSLLVLINAFVGGMVGIERTVVPLVGTEEFGIGSEVVVFSFWQIRHRIGIVQIDGLPAERRLLLDPVKDVFRLNDCGNTSRGETPSSLYSSIISCAYACWVKPLNGIVTLGALSSGVIFAPRRLNNAILSRCGWHLQRLATAWQHRGPMQRRCGG
jgi:hypothetical protein